MSIQIMLDLETMGVGPDAAIVAIGACAFDPALGTIGDRYYCIVDLADAVACGGTMDASTVLWWMRQSDAARAVLRPGATPIHRALADFARWLHEQLPEGANEDALRVWGNGADFDCVILAAAYRHCSMPVPWGPYAARCYRTLKSMVPGIKAERVGMHHHAADDAETQARHAVRLLQALCAAQSVRVLPEPSP